MSPLAKGVGVRDVNLFPSPVPPSPRHFGMGGYVPSRICAKRLRRNDWVKDSLFRFNGTFCFMGATPLSGSDVPPYQAVAAGSITICNNNKQSTAEVWVETGMSKKIDVCRSFSSKYMALSRKEKKKTGASLSYLAAVFRRSPNAQTPDGAMIVRR